jgi:hypothetical protein
MTKFLVYYFENEILPKQASETWTINVLSGLLNNNIFVLKFSVPTMDKTFVAVTKLNHFIVTRVEDSHSHVTESVV